MIFSRREFLASGAAAATSLALPVAGWSRDEKLPLAFSSLGCPAWDWTKILEYASANGFAAIELRA